VPDVVVPRRAARSPLFATLRRALALTGTAMQAVRRRSTSWLIAAAPSRPIAARC